MGEYVPVAPVNDDAKKHNQILPGMGGVYNTINLHYYHYAGKNPVRYFDLDGKDIRISGRFISQAIDYLYKNSPTFQTSLRKKKKKNNNLGERLVVYISKGKGNYPGFTQTDKGPTVMAIPKTLTIDENGELQYGSIKESEIIQFISITIDTEKIMERNLNFLEVLIEEIMHAVTATNIGSIAFNEAIIREERLYDYDDRPLEKRAKQWIQRVFNELDQ
jgi:hypothetical protein